MKDFRQKTISGVYWSVVSRGGQVVLNIGITIILARLLSPREFGLIAMVTVITGFANVFPELGFSAALVQKQDIRPEHLASVFWLNLASGSLLMVAFMVAAPLVADFYGEPLLVPLTMFISTNFLINSFKIVQHTIMTKSLDFRTLSIVEIASTGIAGMIATVMAYTGFGVWSLAVQSVAGSMITAMLMWKLSDWRPDFTFNWTMVKDLLGFSANLLGTRMLHYWLRRIDNLLIGRFLGTAELGIYTRAYQLLLFPLNSIKQVITQVLFPSFSIIQDDKAKVKRLSLKAASVIALFVYPMMSGLFVTAVPFVVTLFGSQWVEMIPILRIFCLLALSQSVTFPAVLYMSQGRTDLNFKVKLFTGTNVIFGIVVGLHWGITGVAIGYAIASTINFYPNFFFSGRLVNLTFWELLRKLFGIFGCTVAMAGFVWRLGLLLPSNWPHWTYLAVQVPFGMATYWGLIHVFRLEAYQEVRTLIWEQVSLRLKT